MKVVLRWLLVITLIAAGGWLFHVRVDSETEPYRALAYGAGGLACIVVAAGFAIVPLGHWAIGLIDMLFMPAGTYTPPALYKLPEWYISQGRYADALAEYDKIQKHHPRDLAAFEGRLYVIYACMGDVATAESVFRKGLRRVAKDRRDELTAYMDALRMGTAPVPSRSVEA